MSICKTLVVTAIEVAIALYLGHPWWFFAVEAMVKVASNALLLTGGI
jgi:hypothetical protein